MLNLVYSPVLEVSAYAMATLAMLSALSVPMITSSTSEPVSNVRALFLAGIMFPTNKLGWQGPLDAKLAAARILSNLASEETTLDDMLTGNDETLKLAFYFLSLSSTDDLSIARRDGCLIASACRQSSGDASSAPACEEEREQALIEIKECTLAMLQAVCLRHKYHPRFLKLEGLQVLSALAKSEAYVRHKSIARGIVKLLESLAGDPNLRKILNDNAAKNVAKMLYRRHEDLEIEASMERILVLLQPQHGGDLPEHAGAGDGVLAQGHGEGGAGAGWRVVCQLSTASGDKEQFVFTVAETLSFTELQSRVCRKFGPSVVITFKDEHEELKVLSGDDMLAYAMSLPHAQRKHKLQMEVVVVTPLWEQGERVTRNDDNQNDPERNPRIADDDTEPNSLGRCGSAEQPGNRISNGNQTSKQLLMSRLCDSSPSFRQHGDCIEGPTMRWRLGKLIGEGAYARVFQGINADSGELMAIKQVSLSGGHEHEKKRLEAVSALQREIEVMKLLQHENIVKYLGTETTDDRLNIFLEYVSGGSIAQLISNFGALDEPVVRKYTRQIVVGLDFLHDKGIVHCDIKGGNILVTEDGIIKLADFNSSKQLGNIAGGGSNPLRSLLGTPQFMAPEVIRQTGHGRKADIWSVGCTVVQMLTGAPPWDEISNKITLMFHIASSKVPPSPPENISEDAKDFLRQVFQIEPRDRPSCQHLLLLPFCIDRQKSGVVRTEGKRQEAGGQERGPEGDEEEEYLAFARWD